MEKHSDSTYADRLVARIIERHQKEVGSGYQEAWWRHRWYAEHLPKIFALQAQPAMFDFKCDPRQVAQESLAAWQMTAAEWCESTTDFTLIWNITHDYVDNLMYAAGLFFEQVSMIRDVRGYVQRTSNLSEQQRRDRHQWAYQKALDSGRGWLMPFFIVDGKSRSDAYFWQEWLGRELEEQYEVREELFRWNGYCVGAMLLQSSLMHFRPGQREEVEKLSLTFARMTGIAWDRQEDDPPWPVNFSELNHCGVYLWRYQQLARTFMRLMKKWKAGQKKRRKDQSAE